ncbi:MAG: heparinase II/III family protein [Pseudomonadota bacterium]
MSRVQRAWGESPFYQSRLKGPSPDRLYFHPKDPRGFDKAFAISFAEGAMSLGDDTLDCEGELAEIWAKTKPGGAMFTFLQEFSWLRHLDALGEKGRAPARAYLKAWLDRYEKWAPDVWEPFQTSERLFNLCCFTPLVLSGTDALWRSRVLTAMARQTRHLARVAHRPSASYDRLMAAMNLAIAGFCLPGCDKQGARGLELVRRELRLQLLPDGAHAGRNPSRQLAIALRLQAILAAMKARNLPAPGYVRHMTMRASAIVQFFRCADGKLAVFNGGYEDDGLAVAAARSIADNDAAPMDFARHAGYQRLSSARALVILDVASKTKTTREKYDSTGSFHFSSGRARIVANCGGGAHLGQDWLSALRARGAHSALSFDDIDADALQFGETSHRRGESPQGFLAEVDCTLALRDAPAPAHYRRRLFLAASGDDLRGEEEITGLGPAFLQAARWRFHLHPDVRASMARDGRSVLLALPNKEGWRFRANCRAIALEKSVYCGAGGAPAASEQIVLSADPAMPLENDAIKIKWAFKRLAAG